ncbi:MAG TPA: hypothetical protein VF473_00860 [Cyclobacteriaceae bacterium]
MKSRIALVLLCLSCTTNNPTTPSTPEPTTLTSSSSSTFSGPRALALIDEKLPEASGLAASVVNPGSLWVINDSGNPAEVYLIDTTAHVKLTCKLKVTNRDWEEVAVGPGPVNGKTYVYVGEIGDNNAIYDMKYIYRFEEPAADQPVKDITIADTLRIKLSDGERDTETMLIDPINKDFYIISKREDNVGVYKVPQPFTKGIMTAQKVATIPFFQVVAGGFSPDGTEILLKDYDHVYYWKRSKDELLENALMRKPEQLPYSHESQGEALAWRLDAKGYYTLSETNPGKPAYLMEYRRR